MSTDIISRAMGTDTFIASKTVYRDLVHCMSRQTAADYAILNFFKDIHLSKLYARPENGAYGLIQLKIQLQGHRDAVLAALLTDQQGWYIKYLRLEIKHRMAKIMSHNRDIAVHGRRS